MVCFFDEDAFHIPSLEPPTNRSLTLINFFQYYVELAGLWTFPIPYRLRLNPFIHLTSRHLLFVATYHKCLATAVRFLIFLTPSPLAVLGEHKKSHDTGAVLLYSTVWLHKKFLQILSYFLITYLGNTNMNDWQVYREKMTELTSCSLPKWERLLEVYQLFLVVIFTTRAAVLVCISLESCRVGEMCKTFHVHWNRYIYALQKSIYPSAKHRLIRLNFLHNKWHLKSLSLASKFEVLVRWSISSAKRRG